MFSAFFFGHAVASGKVKLHKSSASLGATAREFSALLAPLFSADEVELNVNPGLINHGLLIRGYSSNSHNLS